MEDCPGTKWKRITGGSDITSSVYHGRRARNQTNKSKPINCKEDCIYINIRSFIVSLATKSILERVAQLVLLTFLWLKKYNPTFITHDKVRKFVVVVFFFCLISDIALTFVIGINSTCHIFIQKVNVESIKLCAQ